MDKASAARAILGLSKRIVSTKKKSISKLNSDESEDSDGDIIIVNGTKNLKPKDDNTICVKDIRSVIPQGIWRKGQDYFDSRSIFLRFATKSDAKLPIEKPSKFYIVQIVT